MFHQPSLQFVTGSVFKELICCLKDLPLSMQGSLFWFSFFLRFCLLMLLWGYGFCPTLPSSSLFSPTSPLPLPCCFLSPLRQKLSLLLFQNPWVPFALSVLSLLSEAMWLSKHLCLGASWFCPGTCQGVTSGVCFGRQLCSPSSYRRHIDQVVGASQIWMWCSMVSMFQWVSEWMDPWGQCMRSQPTMEDIF